MWTMEPAGGWWCQQQCGPRGPLSAASEATVKMAGGEAWVSFAVHVLSKTLISFKEKTGAVCGSQHTKGQGTQR